MKTPQTFRPEGNLDRKTEELRTKKSVYAPEEIRKTLKTLYKGLEGLTAKEFNLRAAKLESEAFKKIIKDTSSGEIEWKKDSERYITKAKVLNAEGEGIIISVLYYPYGNNTICGELFLIYKDGPRHGTCNLKLD